MPAKQKIFLFAIGLTSFCCVVICIQIVSLPLLQYVFPQRGLVEPILLSILFLGMAAGERVWLNPRVWRWLSLVTGLGLLATALFFSPAMLFALAHGGGRAVLLGILVAGNFRIGQLMAASVYFSESAISSYGRINLFLMLLVPVAEVILLRWGVHFLLGSTGIFLLLAELCRPGGAEVPSRPRAIDVVSALQGTLASLYLVMAFRIFYLVLWPMGMEFPLYLLTAFGFLAVSSFLARAGFLPVSSAAAGLLGAAFFLGQIIFVTAQKNEAYLLFSTYARVLPQSLGAYTYLLITCVVVVFFLLPYFFFSALFALREREAEGRNHLFSLSLGNAVGFLLASTVFASVPAFYLAALLLVLAAAGAIATGAGKTAAAAMAMLVIWGSLAPRDLDLRLVRQAKTLTPQRLRGAYDRAKAARWESIDKLYFRDGGVGFVIEDGGERRSLGFGGYVTPINSDVDVLTGHVAADLHSPGKSVLILGLGNRVILNILTDKNSDTVVDVVDNFGPFSDPEFLARINGYIPPNFRFIYEDIFPLLARGGNRYDLIVANIAWPSYFSARKLYTEEFITLVKRALKPGGVFISEALADDPYRCRLSRRFLHVTGLPRDSIRPQAASVASDADLRLRPRGDAFPWGSCDGVPAPTLGRPFLWGGASFLSGIRYDSNAISIPLSKPLPDKIPDYTTGLSQAFSKTGSPFFLGLTRDRADSPFVKAAEKAILATGGAYALVPPKWLSDRNRRYEALVASRYVPGLRVVTDEPAEELPSLLENGVETRQFLSLFSAPEKGIRSVLDLEQAGSAVLGDQGADSPIVTFGRSISEEVKREVGAQLARWRGSTGAKWKVEVLSASAPWPATPNGEILLRMLTTAESRPVPPRSENQILLPLVDPESCRGFRGGLPEVAAYTAAAGEDPWGPGAHELFHWRGHRKRGSRFRFDCGGRPR